ncbi:amidinotransferase [Desulfonema ishimotonii]|uniref:Amidinotransferase n=1 Tax=Desulfonema ishimotonii TaxID=45657 RepID=A0A401FWW4_9BACT|nr:arginine deiminase family protein [Desulfonema ishimotonii]GBC61433.1 amidinotransferase [Desulfonema ishimotonii]
MFSKAITRTPAPTFASGITTALSTAPPDYGQMLKQHDAYLEALKRLGLDVIVLDPEPAYPDAHFVEDTAVVTPHVAVITHPGADARKGETATIEPVLARFRELRHIQAPGTLDGGDVLMVGNHFFVGISDRTNREGAEQFARILEEFGCTCSAIPLEAGLHLKSSLNYVGKNTMLVTRHFADHEAIREYEKIVISDKEAYAANTLLINDVLLTPVGYPETRKALNNLGMEIIELDTGESRKMDGGLTCLSLRF